MLLKIAKLNNCFRKLNNGSRENCLKFKSSITHLSTFQHQASEFNTVKF